jgi:hypothetical protein
MSENGIVKLEHSQPSTVETVININNRFDEMGSVAE